MSIEVTTTALVETSNVYRNSANGSSYNLSKNPVSAYLAFTPKDNFTENATSIQTIAHCFPETMNPPSAIWLIPIRLIDMK